MQGDEGWRMLRHGFACTPDLRCKAACPVQAIRVEFGDIPVIFVTAMPESCSPYTPPGMVFRKPMDRPAIGAAFRRMAFAA